MSDEHETGLPAAPEAAGEAAAADRSDGRKADGTFAPGHTYSLKHGGRSARVQAGQLAEQAEAVAALAEAREQIVRDLGGRDELSQLQRDLVTSYVRLGLIEDFCFGKLEASGPFTSSGKQRPVVQTLLRTIERRQSLATTLGLQRRTKATPDLRTYLAERERS